MATRWIRKTQGHTLETVRQFLADLFRRAELDAMLIPMRTDAPVTLDSQIVDDPAHLVAADPFAPIMHVNAAKRAVEWLRDHSGQRLGAVLRACEIRALLELAKRDVVDLDPVLLVGVDCIGTFPVEDLAWRKSIDQLTDEMLQFARQGGINTYRYRSACQMCTESVPTQAALSVDLLGLPAREVVLITGHDPARVAGLRLDEIAGEQATPDLIAQHERMVALVTERRQRARERAIHALETDLAMDVDRLIQHLAACTPCRSCLDVCAIYSSDPALYDGGWPPSRDGMIRWLTGCAGCGMCEAVCPDHLPLVAIFARIRQELTQVLAEHL
jgi:formate dehydrogenase subunit beta